MSVRGECLVILAFLIVALVLASLVAVILARCFRAASAKPVLDNLTDRIKAWWVMVIVVGGAILAGRQAVIVLFAFVSLAALREFITLTPTRRADYGALFLSFFLVLPMQYGLIWVDWYGFFAILIPVYAFLILPIPALLFPDSKNFLARTQNFITVRVLECERPVALHF